MMQWPNWNGATCVVVGNGPSRCNGAPSDELVREWHKRSDNHKILACNRAYREFPDADWLHAYDYSFWQRWDGALDFAGIKTVGEGGVSSRAPQTPPGVHFIPMSEKGRGWPFQGVADHYGNIIPDTPIIHRGRETGYQAIQLAVVSGAKKIILIGFDASPTASYYDKDAKQSRQWTNVDIESQIKFNEERLAPALKQRGIECINCTPDSALDCYPKARLEDVL